MHLFKPPLNTFYFREVIFNRLRKLNETELFEGINTKNLPYSVQLQLVLYLIEVDFHFTGNGVWVERMASPNFERNTLASIPVPNTKIRYGRVLKTKEQT